MGAIVAGKPHACAIPARLYTVRVRQTSPTSRAHLARPAWFALLFGAAFAISLAFVHARLNMPAYGILGAWAFCVGANLRGPSPRRIALLFAIPSLLAYAWLQRWLIGITVPGYLGLVVLMGAELALAMWLGSRASRRTNSLVLGALIAGTILAALDFARGRVILSGYPWYTLSQPMLDIVGVPTLASWIGMHGVNTFVCFLGALLALFTLSPDRMRWLWPNPTPNRHFVTGLLFTVSVAIAINLTRVFVSDPAPITGGVPVGVVQTNVPQSNKQSSSLKEKIDQFAAAVALTRDVNDLAFAALGDAPAFIAWPETMFPAAALNDDGVNVLRDAPAPYYALAGPMRDSLLALQSSIGVPMLVGAMALENPRVVDAEEEGYVRLEHDGAFNSVFLVRDGGVQSPRYDKMHLTPFGEVMPLISRSDWLERQLLALGAPGMSFDLSAGDAPTRFEIGELRVATPICFEATMPHVCRKLAFEGGERKANLLLNATNDGWFGRFESGRRDHLLLARWRAAELATPVVRAANTGISCFIDAQGRVYTRSVDGVLQPGRLGSRFSSAIAFSDAALFARIVPGTGTTLYACTGDVVGWTAFLAGCVLGVFALLPTKNRTNPSPSPNAEASTSSDPAA
jgi:apolipoprotein N-acyltransferase